MTHNDIYTKFMIEYDKANVTSSYPSLTKYEVATILDKAYHAFIAQKVTGNNPRGAQFEADVKAIADILPLIVHKDLIFNTLSHDIMAINVSEMELPRDFMYYVQMLLEYTVKDTNIRVSDDGTVASRDSNFVGEDSNEMLDFNELYYGDRDEIPLLENTQNLLDWHNVYYSTAIGDPVNYFNNNPTVTTDVYDKIPTRVLPVKLVSHAIAERFMVTLYNMPWVKNPVAYIQNNNIYVVYDPINKPRVGYEHAAHLIYIKKPAPFAVSIKNSKGIYNKSFDFSENTKFELLDSAAQEVINLAVIMALENVESSRLNTKINMRGLES